MQTHSKAPLAALALGALGVVFGDIGTSPLYALAECFQPGHGVAPEPENVIGLLSLMFWSMMLVVTLKYVLILMRADNGGEGGIMALLALVPEEKRRIVRGKVGMTTLMVLAGAGLLFGDGIITPAISVLSAFEGLTQADPNLGPYVVPITLGVLVLLFAIQSRGTGMLGNLFGPVMVCWFLTLAGLGIANLGANVHILQALSPHHAIGFLLHHGWHGFTLLGSVVLVVTGGEALYADMGHFGARATRVSWLGVVLPALVLNYFGQGALILNHPELAVKPFFNLTGSQGLRYALVLLAAMATVIASQALISAVFSLTHQAIQLGYFPRVKVQHTSSTVEGQIYIPSMNWFLALSCLALVAWFKQSSKLAAAYGLAVSGTMLLTSLVFYTVTRERWHWPVSRSLPLLLFFLSFDLAFLVATSIKFFDGGYIPFLVGALVFAMMALWCRGRSLLRERHQQSQTSLEQFREAVSGAGLPRIPGTGIFLNSSDHLTPISLQLIMRHFRTIPERLVFLRVQNESRPHVEPHERHEVKNVNDCFYQVVLHCGFMERANIPEALHVLPEEMRNGPITYFISRETLTGGEGGLMPSWQEVPFSFLLRNSLDISQYFELPPDRVVEMSGRVDL